jgi:hypothetical protein
MFYRVRARLKQNAQTGRGRKNKYKNIAAGLLVCGVCGGRVHIHSAPATSTSSQGWQRGYLSCEAATWSGCNNRASFPYGPFEEMLFRLSDTSLARLIPESRDDTAGRRLTDVDSIIAGRDDELAAQQHAYGTLKSPTAKANALAEIDRLGGELDELKREREELARQVKLDQHAVGRAFIERWHEARTMIDSPDEETRLDARRMMMAEYRRIIDRIYLHDGRDTGLPRHIGDRDTDDEITVRDCYRLIGQPSIVISMKPHDDFRIEYDLAVDRVVGARMVRHNVRDALHSYGIQTEAGDLHYSRMMIAKLIDKTGETVLITPHVGELFKKAGDASDAEYIQGETELQLRFAEPIVVGSPYDQRVHRSVEKIRRTIETLNQQGRRVTKLAVAQIGHMSHTTVHKHWPKAISTQ